jgi:hypothetical protein
MRYETSQMLIAERPNEVSTIKLMQSCSLQAWRIADIVSITCRNQDVTITAFQRYRPRKAFRFDAYSADMAPAPGFWFGKPELREITGATRINHALYSTSLDCTREKHPQTDRDPPAVLSVRSIPIQNCMSAVDYVSGSKSLAFIRSNSSRGQQALLQHRRQLGQLLD